jgi:hypothetical protein
LKPSARHQHPERTPSFQSREARRRMVGPPVVILLYNRGHEEMNFTFWFCHISLPPLLENPPCVFRPINIRFHQVWPSPSRHNCRIQDLDCDFHGGKLRRAGGVFSSTQSRVHK